MLRRPMTLGPLAVIALLTIAVVWAGLAFPSPLGILEDGLPDPGHGTGRRARIGGLEFVEFPAGCYRLPCSVEGTALEERLLGPLLPPGTIRRPGAGGSSGRVTTRRCFRFETPVWLSTRAAMGFDIMALHHNMLLDGATPLPVRSANRKEEILWCAAVGRPSPEPSDSLQWQFHPSPDLPQRLAFTLAPGEQRLVEQYLFDGE